MIRIALDLFRPLLFLPVLLFLPILVQAQSPEPGCEPAGDYHYLCGVQSAEDLVLVPDTSFIIASGYGKGAPFYLIDAGAKTWSELKPADTRPESMDAGTFPACPGPPDYGSLVTHGLNIRGADNGKSILYVVGHGAREAIEVFEVDARGGQPALTWSGCVPLTDGLEANSVASLRDGSLLATVPLRPGSTISDAMAGKSTGAVYSWSPGDEAFVAVEGTEMPYPNGIEVSADEKRFFVASSGRFTITAFSRENAARLLRTSRTMVIIPDNLHMGPDGQLITAGLAIAHPGCGKIERGVNFELEEFAACPRPFVVKAIDPDTLEIINLAEGPANARFSNVTMALPVGGELWIGTFAGDRVAYRSLK